MLHQRELAAQDRPEQEFALDALRPANSAVKVVTVFSDFEAQQMGQTTEEALAMADPFEAGEMENRLSEASPYGQDISLADADA